MNVTGLLHRLQVKIENIYLFQILLLIKNMETSLRASFAQIFSCCPKFGGAAAPLAPPAVRLCRNGVAFAAREIYRLLPAIKL